MFNHAVAAQGQGGHRCAALSAQRWVAAPGYAIVFDRHDAALSRSMCMPRQAPLHSEAIGEHYSIPRGLAPLDGMPARLTALHAQHILK